MYLDKRLQKTFINNKGYGIVATKLIKKGETIIIDIPYTIKSKNIKSELFQLLYDILNDVDASKKFLNLCPKKLGDNTCDNDTINKIKKELINLKTNDCNMYNFFINNYTIDEILLFCVKYMRNAFEYRNKPAFLFIGTMLNHSCLPNVIFGEKDGKMVFITIKDIQKNEEICDNYIDITSSKIERNNHLLKQYGFKCSCDRCNGNDITLDKKAILIEKQRVKIFGHSKSSLV